ncbi:hypothetical protein E1263_05690 [Kribbella antibiotica]|uniref:DUF5666 domain-containing protein n=1 Tax=Kribbella antibiotica TaxID=190195 RepID=A0A4R4ZV38_9ACTN|nr:hypothetical protein [Kribbella antibiotica]TDD61879.1 hypothetical protein E1263_05690 [Kribbella antibiotica]
MSNQTPDEFAQIGSDEEVDAALKPKKTLSLPTATAVLAAVVVLAIGLAGGAGLHAAFASDSTPAAAQGRPSGGYGGFRGGQNGQAPGGTGGAAATVGTVVSATDSQLVVKTQNGDVTVKLTGETAIEITAKGKASDLKAGEQVVVTGQNTDGSVTANSVRQGGTFPGGGFRTPSATPTN